MKDPWVLTLYVYLLVLLVVPVLVRWRWGLRASLIVTVAELGLVALVFCLLEAYRVFPDPFAGEPAPRAPMEIMRRGRERHVARLRSTRRVGDHARDCRADRRCALAGVVGRCSSATSARKPHLNLGQSAMPRHTEEFPRLRAPAMLLVKCGARELGIRFDGSISYVVTPEMYKSGVGLRGAQPPDRADRARGIPAAQRFAVERP